MRTRVILLLLLMVLTQSIPKAYTVHVAPTNAHPQLVAFVTADQEGVETEEAPAELTWKERERNSEEGKSMRWRSAICIVLCLLSATLLWKESKKRDLTWELCLVYIPIVFIFFNCLFAFNFWRWFFPVAFYMTFIFPIYYLNLNKIAMWFIKVFGGLCTFFLCVKFSDLVDDNHLILLILPKFLVFIGINLAGYIIFLMWHNAMRCPHCNYFATHAHIDQTLTGEDYSTDDTSYTTYDGETVNHLSNTVTKHYTKHHTYTTYHNKYYLNTYCCRRCERRFTKNSRSSEEISKVST